jgi:hypothetical protein
MAETLSNMPTEPPIENNKVTKETNAALRLEVPESEHQVPGFTSSPVEQLEC